MSKPGAIHRKIIDLLKTHPHGLTIGEIRQKLNIPADQQAQLDRRKRDLKRWYKIDSIRDGGAYRYIYGGDLAEAVPDAAVSAKLRAQILGQARGRCGMCGETIEKHGITLVVDHKVPQDWGGSNDISNLWAICERCNGGKKAFFSSQDPELMRQVMGLKSVHERIAKTLQANLHKAVPSATLDIVANQDDWQKRLRELRYLEWDVKVSKSKQSSGKVVSSYLLKKVGRWPTDMTGWIRKYEQDRALRNRSSKRS